MGKIYFIIALTAAMACASASASGTSGWQDIVEAPGLQLPTVNEEWAQADEPIAMNSYDLVAVPQDAPKATKGYRGSKTKAVTSVADVAGEYVLTCTSLTTGYDAGFSVTITTTDDADSVAISNFYGGDSIIKAKVDISAMTISIPCQVIGYNSTYSSTYSIVYYSSSGYNRNTDVTGTISSDGTITLTSYWGVFLDEGTYANYYFGLFYGTEIEPANGVMTYDSYSTSSGDTTIYTMNVVVEQVSSNTLTVKNFWGNGYTVYVTLRYDKSAEIDVQTVLINSSYHWHCHAATYTYSDSWSVSRGNGIVCDVATDLNTISWGNWNLFTQYGSSNYYNSGLKFYGKITTSLEISYPQATTLSGDGTESSPYLISTPAEWNALATEYMAMPVDSLTGKYVKLTADLDFSDTRIKALGYDHTTYFDGDLDGNGKTIKGISAELLEYYSGGLVATAGPESSIHDITVEGDLETSYAYAGGVVGVCYGDLTNVVSKVNITHTTSQYSYVGGIAGYAQYIAMTNCAYQGTLTSSYNYSGGLVGYYYGSTVSGCYNTGSVTGASYVGGLFALVGYTEVANSYNEGTVTASGTYIGGIAGWSYYDMTYTNCHNSGAIVNTGSTLASKTGGLLGQAQNFDADSCYNTGTITIDSTTIGYVGGLTGYFYGYNTSTVSTIKNCYNTADISGYSYVAGLLGYGATTVVVEMTDCYNTGNITSTGSSSSGIYTAGLSCYYYPNSTFSNCYNTGTVTSSGNYAGGLFAYYRGTFTSTSVKAYITNCYNTGDITSTGNRTGGVFSYLYRYVYVSDCYNTGKVTGVSYVGGVVGQLYGNKTSGLHNSYNGGDVTASTSYAGGIAGYTYYRDTIESCFNTGKIEATTSYAGGICGYGTTYLTNCYNAGDVTSANYVGGIVGTAKSGSYTNISNVYNSGKVTYDESATYYGNIIGTRLSVWGSGNSLSDAYYLSANNVEDSSSTDSISTGLSYAELAALNLGDTWTAGDNYTYPRITALADNDYAKAYAAAVIPDDSTDVYTAMTGVFYLGAPDGVTWTADNSVISYDGQMGYFNADYSGGTITMTATSGDVTATTELVYGVTTGIESILSDDDLAEAEVVSETLYNTSGQIVTAPADGQKAIYIVRRVYSDGTVTTAKEAR